jgi:hypothetical protein
METNSSPIRKIKFFILFIIAKMGFSKLNPGDKVSKTNSVAGALDGNPNFPTTDPTDAEILAAAAALQTAINNAKNGDKEMIAIRNAKEQILANLMYKLQLDITKQSNGDPIKILSAGMEPSAPRSAVGLLGPVEGVAASATLVPGEIQLKWPGIKKTKVYVVQMANAMMGPITNWELVGQSSKARFLVTGLNSGQVYFFRVACVTSAGLGQWSEAVMCKAY